MPNGKVRAVPKDISFASFNLYNLQSPGKRVYGNTVTRELYDAKISWTASALQTLNADVICFQELCSAPCLVDAFERSGLGGEYRLE